MTFEGRAASCGEELRMAQEELTAAERLLESNLARIALTRVYFAVFHAARGLLFAPFQPVCALLLPVLLPCFSYLRREFFFNGTVFAGPATRR